jgi:hypothetical protein
LLGDPEAELKTTEAKIIQEIYQQDSTNKGNEEPDAQQRKN